MPDVSGDALAIETERTGRYPAIRSLLAKCAAVMVLADAPRLQNGDHAQDFVTLKLLSLIGELRDGAGARAGGSAAPNAGRWRSCSPRPTSATAP